MFSNFEGQKPFALLRHPTASKVVAGFTSVNQNGLCNEPSSTWVVYREDIFSTFERFDSARTELIRESCHLLVKRCLQVKVEAE